MPSSFRHLGYTANKTHKDPCLHGAFVPVMGDKLSILHICKLLRMPESESDKCYKVKIKDSVRGVQGAGGTLSH